MKFPFRGSWSGLIVKFAEYTYKSLLGVIFRNRRLRVERERNVGVDQHYSEEVEACLKESGIKEALVLVDAMHITASVFIDDDESRLHFYFEAWLEKLAPNKPV